MAAAASAAVAIATSTVDQVNHFNMRTFACPHYPEGFSQFKKLNSLDKTQAQLISQANAN
jgi:hypothetical protein